jgi:23S rRNA U2552 (ribose-2'-O)-methylase RlmE/FtsJ
MEGLTLTDIIWDSNYFVLDLNPTQEPTFISEEKFSEKPSKQSESLVDSKSYKKILEIKEKIAGCTHWDKWSKLINPYDKVSRIAKQKNNRDYYKFYEIIKYFNLTKDIIDKGSQLSSIHLGESSPSFVKALVYFIPKINWYAEGINQNENKITLTPLRPLTPAKSQNDLKLTESDLEFYKSKDAGGATRFISPDPELSTEENLLKFKDYVGKVDFFTSDINLDTSHDPNNQEQLLFHTIFSHIVLALHMQEIDGNLIIKIFDTQTRPTCQLIYYLTNFYSEVSIIKPRTSRYSNSEKYIVAMKFNGIDTEELAKCDEVLTNWKKDLYCRDLGIDIPDQVKKQFFNYNQRLIDNQYNYIEKTIKCSYNEEEIPEKQLEAFQNKKALDFCVNFGITVNLADSELTTICKHLKKKKIPVGMLKNSMVCEKCFSLLLIKP